MIEIYGKDFCPYCDKAVALCEQNDQDYTYKKLGRDFTREDLFEKFPGAEATLTTSMKSVGEAMAIGRTFLESLQKALNSMETGLTGKST